MRFTKQGFVLLNKETKDFATENGEQTWDIFRAEIFETLPYAEMEIESFDCPDEYEIWEVETIITTN